MVQLFNQLQQNFSIQPQQTSICIQEENIELDIVQNGFYSAKQSLKMDFSQTSHLSLLIIFYILPPKGFHQSVCFNEFF